MRTAVDTNVFCALLSGDPESTPEARAALESARSEGTLVVSPAVYAELVAGWGPEVVNCLLSDKGIDVDWNLGPEEWRMAGTCYGAYARDRRRQRGDRGPRRILVEFLIGAHALHLAHAPLTSDTRIYGTYFSPGWRSSHRKPRPRMPEKHDLRCRLPRIGPRPGVGSPPRVRKQPPGTPASPRDRRRGPSDYLPLEPEEDTNGVAQSPPA